MWIGMKTAWEFPPAPDVGQPNTKSTAEADTVAVERDWGASWQI